MVLVALATAAQAWLMEPVLDRVFLARDGRMLLLLPLALLLTSLVKGMATYGQEILLARIGQRIAADLQTRLYGHLIRADLAFLGARGAGPLITHLTQDVALLRQSVSGGATALARDSVTLLFLAGLMLWQDWRLALLALVGLPLMLGPVLLLGQRGRRLAHALQEEQGRMAARIEQSFHAARQLKAYGREAAETLRTRGLVERLAELAFAAQRIRSLASPLGEIVTGAAIALVVFYGGSEVIRGATTPGAFFSFLTALIMTYQPLRSLARLNGQLQEGMAAASRIHALLDQEPEIQDRPDARPLQPGPGAIRFERLSFAYDGRSPALHGLDLAVPAGSRVALVGASGSGKSTLLDLLLRFREPSAGRILIDGQDIALVTIASLRSAIALVSQEPGLVDDTIAANIAFGRPDATPAAIEAAARAAAAHGFIAALPQGYATLIGPHGHLLSGGERQRLAIARAMLKDAPILVLDEATSALDGAAERHIQGALAELMRGRTVLLVAHRLETVRHAELIAVLEEGRIVETGRHDELLARGGAYARLHAGRGGDRL